MNAVDARERAPRGGRPIDPALEGALLDAALAEIVEIGYARFTTAGVAKRAGSSTASLYRRWPSKQALIAAAAERLAARATAPVDTGTFEGDLEAVLRAKTDLMHGAPGIALASLTGQAAHDPEVARILGEAVYGPIRRHVAAIVERAAARGEIAGTACADDLASLVIGAALAPTLSASCGPIDPSWAARTIAVGLRASGA